MMRWLREKIGGVDGLDIAAVWPSSPATGGLPIPQLDRLPSRHERRSKDEEEDA
jgi:hypothetical protein